MTAGRPPSRTISTSRPSARSSVATASALRLDVRLVEGVEGDAGDPGQRLEVGADLRHQRADAVAQGGDLVVGENVGHGARPYPPRSAPGGPASGLDGAVRGEHLAWGRVRTQQDAGDGAGGGPPAREGAKNRPTPRRRDQEAARRQPLVPADRKRARQQERARRSEQLALTRQAMVTGDEKHLPPRDKGPVRRYIRDYVDARWNLAEFMLPVMVVVLAFSFLRIDAVLALVTMATYGIILVAVLDTFLMWRRCKRLLVAKFGADQLGRGQRDVRRDARLPAAALPDAAPDGGPRRLPVLSRAQGAGSRLIGP